MAFNKYGKIIDITLTLAGVAIPVITKIRNDKKAEEAMAKKIAEEVAKQIANRN